MIAGGHISIYINLEPQIVGNLSFVVPAISISPGGGGILDISPDTTITVEKRGGGVSSCEYGFQKTLATLFVVAQCQGSDPSGRDSDNASPALENSPSLTKEAASFNEPSQNLIPIFAGAGAGVVLLAVLGLAIGFFVNRKIRREAFNKLRRTRVAMAAA